MRLSWEKYALNLAVTASWRSEDHYVQVGACALGKDNMVLGNVSGVMNDTLSSACIETFKEFQALINYEKSKY